MKRLAILVSLASLLVGVTAGTTATADGLSSSEKVALAVYTAADPAEAVQELDDRETALLVERMGNWTSVVTETVLTERTPSAQESVVLRAAASPAAATKCYSQYEYRKWYDLAINTGDTWMTAHWCSNGTKVTSYRLSGQGGVGYKGISYSGLGTKTANNVGWEVRQAQQFKFNIWILGAQPCMQIRGGANGKYSSRGNCNLS